MVARPSQCSPLRRLLYREPCVGVALCGSLGLRGSKVCEITINYKHSSEIWNHHFSNCQSFAARPQARRASFLAGHKRPSAHEPVALGCDASSNDVGPGAAAVERSVAFKQLKQLEKFKLGNSYPSTEPTDPTRNRRQPRDHTQRVALSLSLSLSLSFLPCSLLKRTQGSPPPSAEQAQLAVLFHCKPGSHAVGPELRGRGLPAPCDWVRATLGQGRTN